MINILRDIPEDLRFGRCYIPEEALDSINMKPDDLMDDTNLHRVSSRSTTATSILPTSTSRKPRLTFG